MPHRAFNPYLNHVTGDAAYHLSIVSANGGVDLGSGLELYSNATYGKKTANAFENYRLPNRLPALYPYGFNPRETMDETDFGVTAGIKGRDLAGWNWDLSTTYGRDKADMGVSNSANIALYTATGATPTVFYAGQFVASQWTTNFDVNRALGRMARSLASGKVIGVVTAPGDRRDADLRDVGRACAVDFDDLIVYQSNPRGRAAGETGALITAGIRQQQTGSAVAVQVDDVNQALRLAIAKCAPGDVLVFSSPSTPHALVEALRVPYPEHAAVIAAELAH